MLLFCLACGLLVAGCGGLPLPTRTTAVRPVSVVGAAQDADVPRRIPPGPAQNATPADVVRGYLAAGADSDVAREYLTPGNSWDPLAATTVYGSVLSLSVAPTGAAQTAVASLDAGLFIADDGSTRPMPPSKVSVSLTRTTSGWRIVNPPRGTYLRLSDLQSGFRQATVGWLAPGRRSLVRESVLLPGDGETVVPTLARALVQGPSSRLAAAGVTTALSPRLSVVRAEQVGSEVDIDLQGPGAAIPASDAPAARAQLAATMLSLPGVTSVRLDIAGQPLLPSVSGVDAPVTASDEVGFDRDQTAASVVAERTEPGSNGPLVPLAAAASQRQTGHVQVDALAVSADGQRVAELRPMTGGEAPYSIGSPGAAPVQLADPGGWTSVSWGPESTLWLTHDGAVLVAARDRSPSGVSVSQSGVTFASLLLLPDGVHAIGVTTAGGLVEGLADAAVSPPTLTDVHPVVTTLSQVGAVTLSGSDSGGFGITVQGHDSASGRTGLWQVSIGAPSPDQSAVQQPLSPVAAACGAAGAPDSLTALPGHAVLANCPDGSITSLGGDGVWSAVARGVAAYPSG